MEVLIKPQVYAACRMFMRPIASLLMRCGMTWKEFAELCKSVFVEVASEEYGIKGRKTNVSRTAILTGLSRKEVKRQRDLLDSQEPTTPSKTTDPTRVLAGWHQDQDFIDEQGRPLELTLNGKGATFVELLRRYGGDIPSGAMLKELKIAKAVEETDSKKLRVTSRYYMPIQMEPELIVVAGSALQDLGATLNNNVVPSSRRQRRFEGRAMNESIDAKAIPAFHQFLEKQGQEFLERLDDWLTEHQTEDGGKDRKNVRLGVGLYAIEDTTNMRGRT